MEPHQHQHQQIVVPFPRLPEELVKLILECACEPVNLKASSPVPADVSTLLSLLLVSRATYNLLIPRLYRSLTISKPSQLIAFTATLLHRPALGLLVRNLWVGALDVPLHSLPIIVSSHIGYAIAAKDHIERREREYKGNDINVDLSSYKECNDLGYLENGVEFAAMHVQSLPSQMTQPRPPPVRQNRLDYWNDLDAWSSTSSAPFGGFGVDRESAGYDAAGEWIGMDEWMLRCIELQNMIEFHWEWIAATCPSQDTMEINGDEEAKTKDPIDWADVRHAPPPLPSIIKRDQETSLGSMSASMTVDGYPIANQSRLGFDHLSRFLLLRQKGYSPRASARIIIESHSDRGIPIELLGQDGMEIDTLNFLQDSFETDHFSHPALFARSGAIELILGCEPPEGENAPPNAIPASSAVFSAFGSSSYSSDEESESDEDGGNDGARHIHGHAAVTMEGRQRERERNALDFADLYGHVSHDSRTLFGGASFEKGKDQENLMMALDDESQQPPSPIFSVKEDKKQKYRSWGKPLPTLGSLLATLRACLSFCPRVRVLGLNGFLERVVGGTRECVGLSELRHLSLGPPPAYWSSALHLHQKTIASVRTMHISGCMLFRSEAMAIGGYSNALPNLREMDWTLWLGHVVEHPITVIDALSYILGHGSVNSTTQIEKVKRKKPLQIVRATLNGEDVTFWSQNAKSEIKNDSRLVLQECTDKEHDANIKAVRVWWEKKANISY